MKQTTLLFFIMISLPLWYFQEQMLGLFPCPK